MNDNEIEQQLRGLPAPELPSAWKGKILATALREARREKLPRSEWPPNLLRLRNLLARNPVTSGVLATLWLLIFLFRFTTPIDPAENVMLAYSDTKPVYLLNMADEIRLVESMQERSGQPEQIP